MNTLTIILLVYVILDILVDSIALVCLRRMGYTLKDIAYRLRSILFYKPRDEDYEYDDDYDDDWVDEQDYTDLEEESENILGD
jgi:hypothetical protein